MSQASGEGDAEIRNFRPEVDSRAFLDFLPEPVIAFDERDRILEWNQAAERMFRLPANEALGQSVLLFVPHHGLRRFVQACDSVRQFGSWNGEIVAQSSTGTELILEARWAQAGDSGAVVGVHSEVGNRRNMEDRARRADRWRAVRRVALAIAEEMAASPRAEEPMRERLLRFVSPDCVSRCGVYRGEGDWVLVAIDRPAECLMLRSALDAAGYSVLSTSDRYAAIDKVEENWERLRAAVISFGPDTCRVASEFRRLHPLMTSVMIGVDRDEIDGLHLRDFALCDPFPSPMEVIRLVAEAVGASRMAEAAWESA